MSWLLCLSIAVANPLIDDFERANDSFLSGHFETAVEGYSALVEQGVSTGPVLYNLGNSHLQAGDLGHAVASYRLAQIYWPRSSDLSANLDFARSSSKAMAAPVEVHPLVWWFFFWRHVLSPSELRWLFSFVNALFWLSVVFTIARPESSLRRRCTIALGVPLLAVGSSLVIRSVAPIPVGVVLAESTKAFEKPSEVGAVQFVVREGTECWWGPISDDSVWVELSDGRGGWVNRVDLAMLRL